MKQPERPKQQNIPDVANGVCVSESRVPTLTLRYILRRHTGVIVCVEQYLAWR